MSGKLKAALEWAARGFRVFPLEENGKDSITAAFTEVASTDPAKIRAWWLCPVTGQERNFNIGCLTTDLVVGDVDVKKGKPGVATFYEYAGREGWDTLVVRTPTGGFHTYWHGPDSSLASPGPGLDIRSHNGYVVAPGSTIDGAAYTVVNDAPLSWVPPKLEQFLRPPGVRAARDTAVEMDTPSGVANATSWLVYSAPIAQEGAGGDATTYGVACKLVRDFALTEETAFELLARHWNDRCSPPWGADELFQKVENAYSYSTGALGSALPETTFGGVSIPEREVLSLAPPIEGDAFGNALDLSAIPARDWLVPRLLMRKAITVLPAAGGSGKSLLTLILAAHLALGKSFGEYVITKPCRSVIYNAEDPLDEQCRRLYAICAEYKFDYEEVRKHIRMLSSDTVMLTIAHNAGRDAVAYEEHVQAIIALAARDDVGLLVLDPLAEIHLCDENDNGAMRFVMATLRRIARDANVALLIPHHTSKPGASSDNKAGNANVARGAGAIVAHARIVMTLFGATDADREAYGIAEHEKNLYVRLDDAKMNLTLASPRSTWFKKVSVKLYNGDDVGVMALHDMSADDDAQRKTVALVCLRAIQETDGGAISMAAAVAAVQEHDTLYGKMTSAAVRTKVERMLRVPVEFNEGTVQCVREPTAGREQILIKLL